jgi:YggT family protein
MRTVGQIIELVLWLFILILIVRFVMDWVQMFARSWTPRGPALVMLELVYSVTDPPIRAIRRIMPPIRLGGMALDLSPMIVLIICYVLQYLNRATLLA